MCTFLSSYTTARHTDTTFLQETIPSSHFVRSLAVSLHTLSRAHAARSEHGRAQRRRNSTPGRSPSGTQQGMIQRAADAAGARRRARSQPGRRWAPRWKPPGQSPKQAGVGRVERGTESIDGGVFAGYFTVRPGSCSSASRLSAMNSSASRLVRLKFNSNKTTDRAKPNRCTGRRCRGAQRVAT